VRNFGLVTVTGQDREGVWRRARRSREVWQEVATQAGIPIVNRGLWLAARRPESAALLEAFLRSDMADGCSLLTPAAARQRCPHLCTSDLEAVFLSPHELRVESREAIRDCLFRYCRGIDRADREILRSICEKFGGGPVGLATLAVAVGEERDTIEDVYEPFLLQQGFLGRTPRGRIAFSKWLTEHASSLGRSTSASRPGSSPWSRG